jgi:hypothetical protein
MTAAAPSPTDLLVRHQPILRYDSQEPYFADSAAEWTDNPGNQLRRADGTAIAAAPDRTGAVASGLPPLALRFLGPHTYGDGTSVERTDVIGNAARDYPEQAKRLHADSRYRNQMYGHWAHGGDGRVWLAYWFFYFYNDFNLLGPLVRAGLHEGDWEMIQLRLDAGGDAPDLALYAQHRGGEQRAWNHVERVGERPVVYPARGSHASYFTSGSHWTGSWWDHADGKRHTPELTLNVVRMADPAYGWITWPGFWGDTKPPQHPPPPPFDQLNDSSPRGPGAHKQWTDPAKLLATAAPAAQAAQGHAAAAAPAHPPPAPAVSLVRDGADLQVRYTSAAADLAFLVVTVNSPQDPFPPTAHRFEVHDPQGTVTLAGALRDDHSYDVHTSIATAAGQTSQSTESLLAASAT